MPAISSPDAAVLRQFPQTVRRYLSIAPGGTAAYNADPGAETPGAHAGRLQSQRP